MTIKPVADLYLIKYEDGRLYKCTRDAEETVDAIGFGFKVEEFVSLDNHRAAMLQGADGNSPVIPDGYTKAAGTGIPIESDGWQLVPVEPTDEMWRAALDATGVVDSYKAMIAAAPQREVTQALAKGMERHGDAMQELAKKEVKNG